MHEDLNTQIKKHSGLVYSQLHKFHLKGDPDAESIAYEALYNALRDYDASKGTKLSTVATVYIYNALGCYVRSLNTKRQIQTVSYNNIAYADDSEEHEFVDLLPASANVEQDYIHKEVCRIAIETFDKLHDRLTNETHKQILTAWKESEFKAQTKEIAAMLGVSQSYVSQVINNFKHSLRKKLEEVYYD